MRVAIAQIAPRILDRRQTLERVCERVAEAGSAGAALVAFGETLVPAYPFWLSRTDSARFESPLQKSIHARYLAEAVSIEAGDLAPVQDAARAAGVFVVLGVAERPADRGGHTIYCSCVCINAEGEVVSVHRKLMPTYEERLSWGIGDGAGLVTHALGPFRIGALNCWENWMPLARAALYARGEDLHVALWPGSAKLTSKITRFVARESRSYVLSASGLIRESDVPVDVPGRDSMVDAGEVVYDGGSCIAGPDGAWVVEPVVGREALLVADLDPARVGEERQNFDPAGHYARPEILRLEVDGRRHVAATPVRPPDAS